jgi:hypothetical protein
VCREKNRGAISVGVAQIPWPAELPWPQLAIHAAGVCARVPSRHVMASATPTELPLRQGDPS